MDTNLFRGTMDALEAGLTCRLLASDLREGDGMFPIGTDEKQLLAEALQKGYSCILLYERRHKLKPTCWISQLFLIDRAGKRKIEGTPRSVQAEDLISADTPVGECIRLLADREFYLVLERERPRKIITRADLNKLPVSAYLFTMLMHLEVLLADAIHGDFPEDSWMASLSPKRRAVVEALYQDKIRSDFDTRKVDCTNVVDKQKVVLKSERLLARFKVRSKKEFACQGGKILHLRNRLTHGQPPLVKAQVEQVQRLSETVSTMDEWRRYLTGQEGDRAQHDV